MPKLKLTPDPTFTMKFAIPVPGGEADFECTFKYRDKDEVLAWAKSMSESSDPDVVLDCVESWVLDDPFDREHVDKLCKLYPGAASEISRIYVRELLGQPRD